MSEHPYPGLRPFHRDESDIFFGREEQVDRLLEKLGEQHFIAVVGPSGYGKSSLVRTGLLAGLETGFLSSAGARWAIADMRPGDRPFARLAAALLEDSALEEAYGADFTDVDVGVASAFLEASLRRGPGSLQELLDDNPLSEGTRLLLLVDQFEEIIRYHQHGEEEAAAFVALLLKASQDERIYVLLTMRTDYLGHCAHFHGLPEAINKSLFLTPRLDREQLTEAIRLPAKVFDGEVEPALVTRLLNDAGDDPDQLPLLQHTLMRMWDSADDHALTLNHYLRLGGLKRALSDHAQEAYKELNENQQDIAQTLFRTLTEGGSDQRDTRRPVALAEVAEIAGVDAAEIAGIVEVFRKPGRNFLTPPVGTELNPDTVLDISHESLIRQWQTLNDWVTAEAESAEIYSRLERDARDWRDIGGALRVPPRLDMDLRWKEDEAPTSAWAARYGGDFDLAMEFLAASERRHREDEERERRKVEEERQRKEEARQRELDAARELAAERERAVQAESQRAETQARAAKRLGRLSIGLVVVVLLAAVAGLYAWTQQQVAESSEERRTTELFQSQLTHASLLARGEDFAAARSVLDQTRELDAKVSPERRHARNFLAWYVDLMGGESQQVYEGAGAPLFSVAVSSDGRILATSGEEGALVLFDVESGEVLQRLDGHIGDVNDVVFHPEGRWLASAGVDRQIIRWSLPAEAGPAEMLQTWEAPASVWALAVSPDGTLLASGSQDGAISLWQAETGELVRRLEGHSDVIAVGGIAFSPLGERLASASYDGTARVWDVATGESLSVLSKDTGVVDTVAFSPDGTTLATTSADRRIVLWDLESGQPLQMLMGHRNDVYSVGFLASPSPSRIGATGATGDVTLLVSTGRDRTLRVWDLESGLVLKVLQGHSASVSNLAVHAGRGEVEGVEAFTASNDGTVRRWDIAPSPFQRLVALPGSAWASAISPDGNSVAVGFESGALRVYSLPDGELLWERESAHIAGITRLGFNADGVLLASASLDDTAKLWAVGPDGSVEERQIFTGHTDSVNDLDFSPDGATLATASHDGKVGLFTVGTEEKQFFDAHDGRVVASVSFDGSGTRLLSVSIDGAARLWDVTTDPPIPTREFPKSADMLASVTFSPDGRSIAIAGRDQTVRVYSTHDAQPQHHLMGHESTVMRAIFSPDGQTLATVSADATVRLWDMATGGELFKLRLPTNQATTVPLWDFDFRCTPTGCWVAVPLTRGKLALYDLGRIYD